MMKNLEKIKLCVSLALILFGVYFGYALLRETSDKDLITLSFAFTGTNPAIATYTPFYAGICLLAGAYILVKTKSE